MTAPAGSRLQLVEHFPGRGELVDENASPFEIGQTIETWLRPFEVALWEISPLKDQTNSPEASIRRTLPGNNPDIQSPRLELISEPVETGMEVYFAEPDPHFRSSMNRPTLKEFRQRGYDKRLFARSAKLPGFQGRSHVLALVLRLKRDGKWWRCRQPADLIQMSARVGDQVLQFEAVPSFRQTENNQWAPWLVFRIRTSPGWSGKDLHVAFTAYLPPEVECQEDGWLVPEWWMEKGYGI